MSSEVDPLGRVLVAAGVVDEHVLPDILSLQDRPLPLASLCYVYGVLSEETLVRALSKQMGMPGVVLEYCTLDLRALELLPRQIAEEHLILPIQEDDQRIYVACEHPKAVSHTLREFQFFRGKPVVAHVGLHIQLARTIRQAYDALERGEVRYAGQEAKSVDPTDIFIVSDADTIPPGRIEELAQEAFRTDVTKEISVADLDSMLVEEPGDTTSMTQSITTKPGDPMFGTDPGDDTAPPLSGVHHEPAHELALIDLDGSVTEPDRVNREPGGPSRVLIVDDDFATRQLLVKELGPTGVTPITASNGGEAVRIIKSDPPDAVIIDVMLPQIDGFQICRAIKQSMRYSHIPVMLMSAVIDSGRVTDEVLERYGADAYFEKPLNTQRLRNQLKHLLANTDRGADTMDDTSFKLALDLYRSGRVDEAVAELRRGIEVDPLSAKHHFVLGNLLQKQQLMYEAIDEYETTVDLMPDYFPALTRLAYLYYKKGFSAKAIETWRRALPHCPDDGLRKNIEVFMRKLIADMQSEF
jgi:DNA-binding response OmpR family regulator